MSDLSQDLDLSVFENSSPVWNIPADGRNSEVSRYLK